MAISQTNILTDAKNRYGSIVETRRLACYQLVPVVHIHRENTAGSGEQTSKGPAQSPQERARDIKSGVQIPPRLAHVIELNLLRRGLQKSAQSTQLMEFRKAPRSMLAARSSSADLPLGSRSNRRVEVTGNW